MAEGQGFEPWIGYSPMPVFKTGAFNRSAIPPWAAHGRQGGGAVNGTNRNSITSDCINQACKGFSAPMW